MRQLSTILTITTLILFSGMNCHNRAIDPNPGAQAHVQATTWGELWANKHRIDTALEIAFGELESTSKQTKKTMVRKRRLEIVAPAGPNTFIFQDSTK